MSNILPMAGNSATRDPLGFDRAAEEMPIDEAAQEAFERAMADVFKINACIKKIFTSEEGQTVLAWLRENTIEAATWQAGLGYQEGIAHGFAREGQNALVRDIENRVKLAELAKSPEDYNNLMRMEGAD